MNQLYYGDNLDILRRYIPDESIDLVYLDPPFKSNQDYNVLFAERDGASPIRNPAAKHVVMIMRCLGRLLTPWINGTTPRAQNDRQSLDRPVPRERDRSQKPGNPDGVTVGFPHMPAQSFISSRRRSSRSDPAYAASTLCRRRTRAAPQHVRGVIAVDLVVAHRLP